VAKFQNRAKRNAHGAKVYDAPVEWVELLRQAVEEPGIISKAYSLFHDYSVGNQMLALWQLNSRNIPIGPIASYSRWQSLGRQVRKGETALVMQVPRTWHKTVEDADGEEKQESRLYFNFKPTAFSYYQTDPIEGVEDKSATLTAETPDWSMARAKRELGIGEGVYDRLDGNRQGYSLPKIKQIFINPMGQHKERTRIHEVAHCLMHVEGYTGTEHRGVIEFEAEAVVLIVSSVLGFGVADESRGYCQTWLAQAGVSDISEKIASRIFSTANKIIVAGRPIKAQEDEQAEEVAA